MLCVALLVSSAVAILASRTYGQTPVIYYPLDESSGTNAYDQSGNGFNASTTNTSGSTGSGATWSPSSGMIGGALRFTPASTTDYSQPFAFNGSANIIANYPFTLAGWIKTTYTGQNGPYEYVFLGDGTSSFAYYALGAGGQNQTPPYRAQVEARNSSSAGLVAYGPSTIPDGNWHHIAGVYTSSTLRSIYVDGVAITASNSTTDVSMVGSIKRFGLGALTRVSTADPFNGYLDDVAAWNVALTPQTIALINAVGRFESLPLTNSGIATLQGLETAAGGSAQVGFHNWAYSANLSTNVNFTNTVGFTGGTAAAGNGYVVLGTDGSGVQMQGISTVPPAVNNFSATPAQVNVGGSVTLTWNVANASTIQINQGIGGVTSSGSLVVFPIVTTTYTLIASNGTCSVTNQVTVQATATPPSRITQSVILPDGHLQLVATGTIGYVYGIQSSLLLTGPWTTLTNVFVGTNGLVQFEDTTTPRPATQFYRTVSPIQAAPPPQASANGYTWTAFCAGPGTIPFSTNSVDVTGTLNPSFQWFPAWFYYNSFTPPLGMTFPTGSGVGTALINASGFASFAAPHSGTQSPSTISGIVGEAFGGGGYFEATFQYEPSNTIHANGWPAWWGCAVEHLKSGSSSNQSQYWDFYDTAYSADPAFAHYAETDFFEDDIGAGYYGGTMIDWYGDWGISNTYWNVQSPYVDKQLQYPANTIYTIPHKYGFLWIPGTTASNGSATFYFDGAPYSSQAISWNQYQGQAPYTNLVGNAPSTPWSFSILDQQHIGLILNTGINEPMTITSVNVWQANGNWDIHTSTLYDTFYDFSDVYSQSNMVIAKPTAGMPAADYNGDTSFAERSVLAPGTLVYHLPNIGSFTARVCCSSNATPAGVTFAISKTGLAGSFFSVPISSATPSAVATAGGFSYADLSNSGSIGSGYNYLQITLTGSTSNVWDLALGQLRIN